MCIYYTAKKYEICILSIDSAEVFIWTLLYKIMIQFWSKKSVCKFKSMSENRIKTF